MLFDSHAHAHFNAYKDDSDEVIKRSLEAGVKMLLVGTKLETSASAILSAEKFDGVWVAIGLHPIHLEDGYFDDDEIAFNRRAEIYNPDTYKALVKSSKKVVAIGEIGLDYYRLDGDSQKQEKTKEKQRKIFQEQLELAAELDLPVCVHCRNAHAEVYDILKAVKFRHPNLKGVIHCFTGTAEEAEKHMSLGFLISFSGIITFAHDWDEFIKNTSLDHLLIETDCPYLSPVPHRGRRNEPSYVEETARYMAKLKGVSFEDVARVTVENSRRLLGIEI